MAVRSRCLELILGTFLLLILAGCEEPRPVGPLSPSALPPGARLTSVSFVDAEHGWVVAASCARNEATPTGGCRALLYATTDGGRTWSPAGRLLLVPRKLEFTDKSTGWLVGGIGQQCGNTPCPNVVMQTTDAGRTWQRTLTASVDLIDEDFASPRDGWILGETCATRASCTATLVSTGSTGQTWVNQQLPLAGRGFRVDRLNPAVGWIGGITNGQAVLIGTRDGGKHWDTIDTPCRGESVAFDFRSPEQGWLACSGRAGTGSTGSMVFHTADAGRSWQPATPLLVDPRGNQDQSTIVALRFTTPKDGWIVEAGGQVLVTHDGGKTWARSLAADQPLVDGQFIDSAHGWVIGSQTIWATADGGKSWAKAGVSGDSRSGSGTMRVK